MSRSAVQRIFGLTASWWRWMSATSGTRIRSMDGLDNCAVDPDFPLDHPVDLQSINQSIDRTINQSINQSINQPINRSINQSINQSVNQSTNQSINQSVDQSINQSINQSTDRSTDTLNKSKFKFPDFHLTKLRSFTFFLNIKDCNAFINRIKNPFNQLSFYSLRRAENGFCTCLDEIADCCWTPPVELFFGWLHRNFPGMLGHQSYLSWTFLASGQVWWLW